MVILLIPEATLSEMQMSKYLCAINTKCGKKYKYTQMC